MSLLSVSSFTNIGYWLHSRDHEPVEADMTGQTVVITGATGGLGRAGAEGLAALGAPTLVVGRSADKLARVEAEITGEVVGYRAT